MPWDRALALVTPESLFFGQINGDMGSEVSDLRLKRDVNLVRTAQNALNFPRGPSELG